MKRPPAPAGSGPALPVFARAIPGGLEIRLKVVPGASRSEVVGPIGDRLKVRVAAPAEAGRANRAVEALLSRWLGVAAGDVEIVAGSGSPEKTVRVAGISAPPEPPPRRARS